MKIQAKNLPAMPQAYSMFRFLSPKEIAKQTRENNWVTSDRTKIDCFFAHTGS